MDHSYVIASPMMDIIGLIEQIDACLGLAHISKEGATLSIDEAFPFGNNSYQQEIQAMQAADPTAPDTLFERDFTLPDGSKINKLFLASTPTLKHHLMALAGFGKCLNFPNDINAVSYIQELATHDDSFIDMEEYSADTPQHQAWINQAKPSLYRTHDNNRGYNRITYLYQKTSEPDTTMLLELKRQLTVQLQAYIYPDSDNLADQLFMTVESQAPAPTDTTT